MFITALVRSLVAGGRLPFFAAMAEGRVARAYLEPQPDDAVPRFAYEEHLARAGRVTRRGGRRAPSASASCASPSSTRHTTALRRALGPGRLHVDIVDYPGEWLIDLPLLEMSFADWSLRAVEDARAPHRAEAAKDWLAFLSTLDPDAPADEQAALTGAGLFTRYLQAARAPDPELTAPGPGRFLLPGDLAGSPLLTFFPLPPATAPPTSAARWAPCWRAASRATRPTSSSRSSATISPGSTGRSCSSTPSPPSTRAPPRSPTCSAPWRRC